MKKNILFNLGNTRSVNFALALFAFTALSTPSFAQVVTAPASGSYTVSANGTVIAAGANASAGTASGSPALAIGDNALANGSYDIAIGSSANATGAASGNYNIAVGQGATASGSSSTAIGQGANSSGSNTIAIGSYAAAPLTGSISIGLSATNQGAFGVAVGENSVAAGSATVVGTSAKAQGTSSSAFGSGSNAVTANSVAIGTAATAGATGGNSEVAIGNLASATGNGSLAIGSNSAASAPSTIAIGGSSVANGNNNVALGVGAKALGAQSSAFGTFSAANNSYDIALGYGSTTALAVGTPSGTIAGNTYTYAGGVPKGTASIGLAGSERTLTNLAAGSVTATSTDGINGSQLFATNTAVGSVNTNLNILGTTSAANMGGGVTYTAAGGLTAPVISVGGASYNNIAAAIQAGDTKASNISSGLVSALGGGATVAPNGTVTAPAYTINGSTYANVGAALTGLAGSQLVQQATPAGTVTVAAATGGTVVNFTGTSGTRTLTGVSPGTISATSVDAVNGSQLFATNNNVTNVTTGLGNLGAGVASSLGGGSTWNPATNAWTAPAYTVNGTSYGTVAGAITALQSSGPVQYTALPGSSTPKAVQTKSQSVTLVGASSTLPVSLNNVAAGALTSTSVEAVNGSQLYATNQTVSSLASGTAGLVQQATPTSGVTVAASTGGTSVDITGIAGARTLNGLASGIIAAGSTQGVNGGQIAANQASVAAAIGGGSTVNPNGTISAPSYSVQGSSYNNVGSALGAVDTSLTNLNGQVSGLVANQLVKQATATSNVTVAAATGGAAVDFTGTAGARTLNGVAAGTVSATSTQAVNGSQLFGVTSTVSNLGSSVAGLVGGTATYNPATGTVSGAGFNVAGSSYGDVTSAFNAVSSALNNQSANSPVKYTTAGGVMPNSAVPTNTVTLVGSGINNSTPVTLDNVAPANLSATSLQAVNGGQLYTTNQNVAALGNNLTNTNAAVAALGNGTAGLVQQANPTAAVTVAAQTGGNLVNVAGTAGNRVVTGVANGNLASGSVDAVNGGQLYAVQQGLASLSTNAIQYDHVGGTRTNSVTLASLTPTSGPVGLHNLAAGVAGTDAVNVDQMNSGLASMSQQDRVYTDQQVAAVRKTARAAGATGAALAGLNFVDQAVGSASLAAAAGGFEGTTAFATGLNYRPSQNVRVNAGVSYVPTTKSLGWNVGASWRFN